MSGFARRVSAIFPPAMISPSTATATASGSIHCWSWPTAGSPARSGDGSCTHQVEVWVTIQVIPDSIAAAIPFSAPEAAVPATAPSDLAGHDAGRGDEHGAGHQRPPPGRGRRCTRPARTARRPSCPSRRRAGRRPSSRRRPRRPRSGPRRVPWRPGARPGADQVEDGGCRGVGDPAERLLGHVRGAERLPAGHPADWAAWS